MHRSMILSVLLLAGNVAIHVPEASAQAMERAYAPEDLRTLSRQDQARVIRKEYAEQSGGRPLPDDQLEFYLDQVNRSSWKFSDVKQDIAKSLAGSRPPSVPALSSVACSSDNFRYRECRTGFPGVAALTQNVSKTRCVEGQNWGSRPGVVWVDKGCQGRFIAAAAADRVICESRYGRYSECRTGFPGRVRLARQLSSTHCVENENWGQRTGIVWVRNSCGAEFVRVPGATAPGAGPNYTVTCESDRGHDRTCAWDSRHGHPVVVQQLSAVSCVEGRTWRYEAGRVWVTQGCGARFGLAGQAAAPAYGIECASAGTGTTWCAWETRRGAPVLAQDHSGRRCIEGRTWGHVPARGIWVADGCSARFSASR